MGQGRACNTGVSDINFVPQLKSGFISNCSFLHQVTFTEEDLPRDDCEYILGYYSNNMNSIVGLSTPIKVTKSQRTKGSHFTSYDIFMNGL